MSDFNIDQFNLEQPPDDRNLEPIPFDDSDDQISDAQISHTPLNLGGSAKVEPAAKSSKNTAGGITSSADRITGVKTFFAKLHAGAIEFLDEQITEWLKNNPGVVIKKTNTVVGEVAAKKTEPNLIVTVWY